MKAHQSVVLIEETQKEMMTGDKETYLITVCEKRQAVVDKIKELTEIKDAYTEAIKNTLGEPQKVTYGDWYISYSEVKTRRIDTKAVRAKYPEIAEECTKESISNRLTISDIKD